MQIMEDSTAGEVSAVKGGMLRLTVSKVKQSLMVTVLRGLHGHGCEQGGRAKGMGIGLVY